MGWGDGGGELRDPSFTLWHCVSTLERASRTLRTKFESACFDGSTRRAPSNSRQLACVRRPQLSALLFAAPFRPFPWLVFARGQSGLLPPTLLHPTASDTMGRVSAMDVFLRLVVVPTSLGVGPRDRPVRLARVMFLCAVYGEKGGMDHGFEIQPRSKDNWDRCLPTGRGGRWKTHARAARIRRTIDPCWIACDTRTERRKSRAAWMDRCESDRIRNRRTERNTRRIPTKMCLWPCKWRKEETWGSNANIAMRTEMRRTWEKPSKRKRRPMDVPMERRSRETNRTERHENGTPTKEKT